MAKCHRRIPTILRRKLLESISCGCGGSITKRNRVISQRLSDLINQDQDTSNPSDRLSDLLQIDMSDSSSSSSSSCSSSSSETEPNEEEEQNRKVAAFEEMKKAVRDLESECGDRRRFAAREIRRIAKCNCQARELLAMLGAIPLLIGLIEDGEDDDNVVYALLNIGIGDDLNKAAIVKAGAIPKMLNLTKSATLCSSISEAIVANLLSLSALDTNKPIIGTYPNSIPFLTKSFRHPTLPQSQQDSLRALFNLSISHCNIPLLINSGLVPLLISSIGDMSLTDIILSVLSNIVCTSQGRDAVTRVSESLPVLVDVLNWIDSPKCQEKAAYILMVISFKSRKERSAMIDMGIKSSLLELVLVGSALAQKRAARLLEILNADDRGKDILSEGCASLPVVSAPMMRGVGRNESEEKRAVNELVGESLEWNLKKIVRRANMVKESGGSSSSYRSPSKSLPF